MKIITYNIKGLGRGLKWASIRKMVKKEQVDMLCIQKTKKEVIDKALCQALWDNFEIRWEMQPTINNAGGILCLWSEETFKLRR